jgi:hypothetical protein
MEHDEIKERDSGLALVGSDRTSILVPY